MQMSLVMSMRFIFGDDWNVKFFISGNDVISLEWRPLNFRVFRDGPLEKLWEGGGVRAKYKKKIHAGEN